MFQRIAKRILVIDSGFSNTVTCMNVFINHDKHTWKMLMKESPTICWFAVLLPSLFTDCIPWFLWSLHNSLFINFQEILIALLHYTTVLQRYMSLWLRYSLPYSSYTDLCSHYIQLYCYCLSQCSGYRSLWPYVCLYPYYKHTYCCCVTLWRSWMLWSRP